MKRVGAKVPVDVWTAASSPGWQEDFEWPVRPAELADARRRLEHRMLKCLAGSLTPDEPERSVRAIFLWLVLEALSLAEAETTIHRLRLRGDVPDAAFQDDRWALSKPILAHGTVGAPLLSFPGVARKTRDQLRGFARRVRYQPSSLFRRMGRKSLFSHDFAIQYANDVSLPVTPAAAANWFPGNLYRAELEPSDDQLSQAIAMAAAAKGVFRSMGLDQTRCEALQAHLGGVFAGHIARAQRGLAWLRSRRDIPAYLLGGSGCNYYGRLAGSVVRERGGDFVCVEHADPNAMYVTSYQGYAEFGICNRYVVYTQVCADLYADGWNATTHLGPAGEPDFVVAATADPSLRDIYERHGGRRIVSSEGRVMYVAAGFRNDFTHLEVRPPDMVYLEWNLFLANALRDPGRDVIWKYHPQAVLGGRRFEPIAEVEYAQGFFEDYLGEDATLIFDHPMSTAFIKALCTSNPIVLILDGTVQLHSLARASLETRCHVLDGYYDERGRFRVDAEDLRRAVTQAGRGKDFGFVRDFLLG